MSPEKLHDIWVNEGPGKGWRLLTTEIHWAPAVRWQDAWASVYAATIIVPHGKKPPGYRAPRKTARKSRAKAVKA